MSEQAPPVKARGLVKRYDDVLAVDHIDLNVHTGDVYGFLGPNGAGKTTTLRMVLGLITPTQGTVELFGLDPMRHGARALDGVAGFVEAPRFYPYLTGRKNLELLAALDGDDARSRIDDVLRTVELSARRDPSRRRLLARYAPAARDRRRAAAPSPAADPRRARDGPRPGRDARHACAHPRPGRSGDNGAALQPPAPGGPGTVRPRRDRGPRPRRLRGRACDLRRQGGAGYRLRTTDDVRALAIAAQQPGVEHAHAAEHDLSLQADEREIGALSLALGQAGIGILALTPELATLEDLFFRLTESGAAAPADAGAGRRPPSGSRAWRERSEQPSPPAPAPPAAAAPSHRGRRPSTLTVYRWELRKFVSQKRTYLGLFLAVDAADLCARPAPAPAQPA